MANSKPAIGLALSGGGVRGLAHIGVLEVLEEAQIPVHYLAGASMGGIIAALYAAGVPVANIRRAAVHAGILDFATPDPQGRGLLGQRKFRQFLAELLGSETLTFADLKIPTTLVAADLETGALVLLREGPLIPAMLATSAFPLVFAPVHHQNRWLVDGGTLNNFPCDVVRCMGADRVIGVDTPIRIQFDLHEPGDEHPRLSFRSLIPISVLSFDWKQPFLIAEGAVGRTLDVINQARLQRCPPDLLINVDLPNTSTFLVDGSEHENIINVGHAEAHKVLRDLRRLRDRPLPPTWRRAWGRFTRRLRRAWAAYHAPEIECFPPDANRR